MVRRLLSAIGIAVALGCASPTLPLPPPALPTIGASSTPGHVHLSSTRGAEPNAIVVIVNRNPALAGDERVSGAQADVEGTWDAEVLAAKGDVLDITQEYGSTRSPSTTVTVK
jgi:hypothetical protein